MDQINIFAEVVESGEVAADAFQKLTELELSLVGGGIGDTIL